MNFDLTPVTSEYRQYPLISKSKETTLSLTFPSIDQSEGLQKGRLPPSSSCPNSQSGRGGVGWLKVWWLVSPLSSTAI